MATSARSTADRRGGSHSHVQKVRDTIAHRLLARQRDCIIANVHGSSFAVLEIRFDETHHEMRLPGDGQGDCGHFPLLMIKATLTWCPGKRSAPVTQELYVSPAALSECCAAESLWAALRQKLPCLWDALAKHVDMLVLVLGHDSHSGNLRLVRGIVATAPPNVWVVSSRCAMHQVQRILCATYRHRSLSFHNPLFCLCKLLHNGVYMKRLRKTMHNVLDRKFRVVYSRKNALATEWSQRFLDLMFVRAGVEDDEVDELEPSSVQQRSEEARAFLAIFNGHLQDTDLCRHHCDLECDCLDEADSKRRAHDVFDTIVLKFLPELASMQHWTKYQPPTRTIRLAVGVHAIFVEAFKALADDTQEEEEAQSFRSFLQQAVGGADGANMPETDELHRLKRTRFRYAAGFIADRASLPRMTRCLLASQLLDGLVRLFFKQSSDDSMAWRPFADSSPLQDLASLEYSPASAAIDAHLAALFSVCDGEEGGSQSGLGSC